jgi:hypothetical protein
MIGLKISSALDSAIAIYIVIPILMIPMMILSGAMFPFDKLNRSLARADRVPLIAEIMPTRWTYEALMVRQFKGNEYDRRVYPLKQQISISDFNTIYRLPRMTEALENLRNELRETGLVSPGNSEISLLRNETSLLSKEGVADPFNGADSLTPLSFNDQLAERLSLWLGRTDSEYRRLSNLADKSLDNYVSSNKMALDLLYNSYHNDKLEDIVRKVYEKNKMLEYRDRLIQNMDLIYLEPAAAGSGGFRTHFMAPEKSFAGRSIDTFRFNILLVLSSVFALYLLLYAGALRRFILFFENTAIGRKRKDVRK